MLLGAGLASSLAKQVGEELEIESQRFTVIGIFAGLNVYESMSAVARLADVQQLLDRPGQVTELQIALDPATARDAAAVADVRRAIEALTDDAGRPAGLVGRAASGNSWKAAPKSGWPAPWPGGSRRWRWRSARCNCSTRC